MIPSNAMAPSLESGTGTYLSHRSVTFGAANTIRGGASIGDGSFGIDFQDWTCTLVDENVILTPLTSGTGATINLPGVTQAVAAFDRSVQPNIAYMAGGVAKLRWYDTANHVFVTTTFAGATRILALHDDPRDTSSSTSDVLVTYQRAGGIYWRQQRDRYALEYTAKASVTLTLTSFGMGTKWRLLWQLT